MTGTWCRMRHEGPQDHPAAHPFLALCSCRGNMLDVDWREVPEGVRTVHVRNARRSARATRAPICIRTTRGADPAWVHLGSPVRNEGVRKPSPHDPCDSGRKFYAFRDERRQGEQGEKSLPSRARIHAGKHKADRIAPKCALLQGVSQARWSKATRSAEGCAGRSEAKR